LLNVDSVRCECAFLAEQAHETTDLDRIRNTPSGVRQRVGRHFVG
jgi:hypothetical protein